MGEHYRQLEAQERGAIFALKERGESIRSIARYLGRSASTIWRELVRNGHREPGYVAMGRPPHHGYDPGRAQQRAERGHRKARRPRKLERGGELWKRVVSLLRDHWSPQQIAGKLERDYRDDATWHVSHETIYTAIYAMPRGSLRRELTLLLRQKRGQRRERSRGEEKRGKMTDVPSIHLRPPEADDRVVPGHWEGDLIKGARNQSCVGTLVERSSLFVMLVKMDGCSAQDALKGYSRSFKALPEELRKTLTYDQGKEMAQHRQLSKRTGLSVYFADPHSPWQRGINENINGLLREYLPKGTDLSAYTQRQLNQIAKSLNTRPRRSMDYQTPTEVFYKKWEEFRTEKSAGVALRV